MGKYWEDLVEHLILSAGVATMLLGLWLTISFGGIGYDFWTASTLESTKEVIKLKAISGWILVFGGLLVTLRVARHFQMTKIIMTEQVKSQIKKELAKKKK